jgi:hypothetical protein
MKINLDDIKVEIKLSSKEKLKATAVVNFGDFVVKGFRLSVSEHENENLDSEKLWMQPPATRIGQFWHKIFWIDDKQKWKELERKIFDVYKNKYSESTVGNDIEWDDIGSKNTI